MNQPISSLMTREVWTIDMDDSVQKVEDRLNEKGLSWAPVLDSAGVVVGVISASDLLQFHAQGRDPKAMQAWRLSTYKPISVDHASPVREVARKMVEQRIHHVVVMNGDKLAGVVSSLDFVRAFAALD
jgi:signal-transduction protein with cAMP-binding, CBS, and nucleotidyltransferase domain